MLSVYFFTPTAVILSSESEASDNVRQITSPRLLRKGMGDLSPHRNVIQTTISLFSEYSTWSRISNGNQILYSHSYAKLPQIPSLGGECDCLFPNPPLTHIRCLSTLNNVSGTASVVITCEG